MQFTTFSLLQCWFVLLGLFLIQTTPWAHAVSTANDKDRTVVAIVGKHKYYEPIRQYPALVREALERKKQQQWMEEEERRSQQENSYYPDDKDPDAEAFDEAAWLTELAAAHRYVVEEHVMHPDAGLDGGNRQADWSQDLVQRNFELAVNAFQQAMQIYQGMISSSSSSSETTRRKYEPQWVVKHHLATVYFSMGELYSLLPTTATTGGDDMKNKLQTANEYLIKSEELYRSLLENYKGPRIDIFSRRQIESGWGVCLLRLGANYINDFTMSSDTSMQNLEGLLQNDLFADLPGMQQDLLNGQVDMENWLLQQHPDQMEQLAKAQEKLLKKIDRAMELFKKAEQVFRQVVAAEYNSSEKAMLQRHLATSLQNQGTAAAYKGDLLTAVNFMEQSVEVYQSIKERSNYGGYDTMDDSSMAVAEACYSLADTYLQLGNYQKSTERYNHAMELYAQTNAVPRPMATPEQFSGIIGDETLRSYEDALEGYLEMINDPGSERPLGDEDMFAFQKDDGYEGDLHTSIGSMYLSLGDYLTAESHLLEAIRLYELSGEKSERSMADAKYNLAAIYFQSHDYSKSAEVRAAALDIYRDVVGEGVNPMTAGIPGLDLSAFTAKMSGDSEAGTSEDLSDFMLDPDAPEMKDQLSDNGDAYDKGGTPDEERTATVEGPYATMINLEAYEEATTNYSDTKDEL